MKIDEYECVMIKRRAQERIKEETTGMTSKQLISYYKRIGNVMRKQQIKAPSKKS